MAEPTLDEPSDEHSTRPIDLGRERKATSSLLFHTLRNLPPRQFATLLVRRIQGVTQNTGSFFRRAVPAAPDCRWEPRIEFIAPGSHNNEAEDLLRGNFNFLDRTEAAGWPPSWYTRGASRLWEYNLHYFEYLWPLEFDSAREVVRDWIANHPLERRAAGWEPYPTSLRLMNWCAVFFARHADRTAADQTFRDGLWRSI